MLRPLPGLLGLCGLVLVGLLDRHHWQTGINYEGAPDLSPSHLVRSVVIALSVMLLFSGLRGRQSPRVDLSGGRGALLVAASTVGLMLLALVFPMLLIVRPALFSTLSMEDGPIEWLSALLYFGCALIFMLALLRCYRGFTAHDHGCWLFAVPAMVFFVLGMEEISWLQRVLGIETFGVFEGNLQNEINLHNFYTGLLETAFYFAAFLFLVVLPCVRVFHPAVAANRYLAILIPLPFVAVGGAMACAYNYDMWNILFMQVAFFGSIVILWYLAGLCRSRLERTLVLAAIAVLVAAQAMFIVGGGQLVRPWEVTEYRELLIPLALFCYSLGVYGQVAGINLASLPAGIQGKTS